MDNVYSEDFIRVELDGPEIKDHLNKLIVNTETKVLVNLLLKQLQMKKQDDKKIKACELLLEDFIHWDEIKEACYCLAYGVKYITYKPKTNTIKN